MADVLVPIAGLVHPPSRVAGTAVASRRLPTPKRTLVLLIVALLRRG
jgi:hypothetical protein